jgi:predicted amidophosphoribosyltransferase
MFCPVCWKEYPKGMQHCDSCRAELIEGMPEGHEGHVHEHEHEHGEPQKPESGDTTPKK